VTIATSTSQGSGVIVHGSGLIANSLHVIRGNIKVSVKLANSDVYDDVNVVEVDEQRDLVLLRIKAVDLDPALLGNSEQVRVGDKVVLIGSPKGLDLTVSDGVISAVRDSGDGYRLFQTSAAASPGSSGGGMFNEAGQLVGILSAKLTSGENLNFAIPVNYLRGLMVAPSRAMSIAEFVAAYPAITQPGGSQRSTAGTASKATPANTDSLLKILDASGLKYKKNNNTSWVVSYSGDHSGQVDVYIQNS
jgi:serine protease Do